MKIVRISDLSEEEKKKVLEEQDKRISENNQQRLEIQKNANDEFNNLASKRSNNTSMWDRIQQTAQKSGYILKKTGAGFLSGTTGVGQGILTDFANNADKGKNQTINKTMSNLANSFILLGANVNPIETMVNSAKILTNKNKNPLQKIVDLGTSATSEITNKLMPGKETANSVMQLTGKILPNTSEKVMDLNNQLSRPSEEINKKLEEEGQQYGTITNTLANVGQAIGNMIPSIGATAITKNPTVGLATMGLSAKGQSTQEALNKGANLNQAVKIGDTKGMIEIGTEMISGGVNIFGKGALDDIVEKGIEKKVKNNVLKVLAQKGYSYAGEVGEEVISDTLGTLIDKGTVDKDAKYTLKDFGNTAITTILTTAVLNALTGGISGNVKNTQNIVQNQTQNENMTPNQQITQQQNNLSQNQSSEQIKAKETLKQEIQNSNLSSKEKNNMIDYVNNNNINPNTYNNMGESIDNANQNINNNLSSAPEIYSNRSLKNNAQIIRGYHGTDAEFNEYNLNEFGKHDQGDFGKAIYFAKDKKTAGKYGKNIKENNISLKNPLVLNNEQDYQNMWHILAQRANINNLSKEDKIILNDNYTSQADKDFMIYDKLNAEEKSNILQQLGYDGVIDNTYNQIAVFDPVNIESNAEMLYNSSNESESGTNEYNSNEQRRIENVYQQENGREQGQRGNKFDSSTTESIMGSQNKNDAETLYREFEQQARKNQLTDVSKESQQVKNVAKDVYNKDVIHYDDNKTSFSGGLAKLDNSSVFFGKNAVDTYGDAFLLGHEIGEDMLKNHKNKVENTYNELKEKIQNDDNFGDVFLNYIFDMDEELKNIYIEHPEAVAKELICDTLGFMQNDNELGNNLPHKDIQDIWINKLNPNLVNEVKQTLKQYHDEIYLNKKNNQELERSSSINLPKKQQKLPTMKDIVSKGEKVDFSEMERPKGKIRKHYKSIIESNNTTKEAKSIAKELMGTDTYVPETNKGQLAQADARINNSSPEIELKALANRVTQGEKVSPVDIAVGERLIQYYSKIGNKTNLQEAIQTTAMAGTSAGQTVQALAMLNHQTPQGQATWIQRSVDKMNNELAKKKGRYNNKRR